MDEDRRIRFLVAPTLFVASLLLCALSNHAARDFMLEALKNPDWSKLIGLIAGLIAGGGRAALITRLVRLQNDKIVARPFRATVPRTPVRCDRP